MSYFKTKRSAVIIVLIVCAAFGVAFGLLRRSFEDPVEIKVVSPAFGDVDDPLTTNGVVEPVGQFEARANFPGMVDRVFVHLGERVHPGQPLVSMKDAFAVSRIATATSAVSAATQADQNMAGGGTQEERIATQADVARATQSQVSAQQGLDVIEQLQKQGGASPGEVEGARRRLEDANVTLRQVKQRDVDRYSQAERQASRDRLADARAALGASRMSFDNANIISPIAGTVYAVSSAPSNFVPMGAELLRVADLNKLQIRSFFDEPELGKLKTGQPVVITWEGKPGFQWHGHINQAPVSAIPLGDRSVAECLITVDDPGQDLLPNTHVVVTVIIASHKRVLTIPREALQMDAGASTVFRVVGRRLERTPVQIGLVNLNLVEVVSGLTPQDQLALHATAGEPLTERLLVRAAR